MSQEHKPQPVGWGVLLTGDAFDLEDWKDTLKPPFEPWVVQGTEGLVLRSESFDTARSAQEVHERSKLMLTWLNGALSLSAGGSVVKAGGVIQFKPDGTEQRSGIAEATGQAIGRARSKGFAQALGPDGKPLPPPPPKPSDVQAWFHLSEKDDLISDAIVYYSRADDWFDIYKCLECLMMRFSKNEDEFLKLDWTKDLKLKLLKRTANSERHARKKFDPPDSLMPKGEAKVLLGTLLRRALNEAVNAAP